MNLKGTLTAIIILISVQLHAQNEPQSSEQNGQLLAEIGFGFGLGFENMEMFETTDGDVATVSAGGGLGIGIGLFYQLANHIQFGVNLGYQVSLLRPPLENADATFKRFIILPEIKFPIKLKEDQYINIGGGYGFFTGGKLKVDAREVTGLTIENQYNGATGIHLITEYQAKSGEKSLVTAGFRFYSPKYTSKSTAVNGQSLGDPNSDLKGGGIDLYFKFSFALGENR